MNAICNPTRKRRYYSRMQAMEALVEIGNRNPERTEIRTYHCPKCGGWHVTKQLDRRRSGRYF